VPWRNNPFFWSHPLNGTHILFLATVAGHSEVLELLLQAIFEDFLHCASVILFGKSVGLQNSGTQVVVGNMKPASGV